MKPGWTTVALGDVAEVRRTSVHPAHMRPDDPYLGLENIERGGRLLSVSTVAGEGVKSTKFRFSPGDVLYGKLRPNLAKILKVDFEGLCSTDILPIAVNSGTLSADFLAYYLSQPQVVAQAASRASGANLPRLAPAELLALRIPLPPLDEQRRIAAILGTSLHSIGCRVRACIWIDDFLDNVYNSTLRSGDISRRPIRSLGEVSTGKTPATSKADYFGGVIPFVAPGDLGGLVSAKRTLTDLGAQESRLVRAGATMVCCIGATIGKVGIVAEQSAFNQQINAIEWGPDMDDLYGYFTMRAQSDVVAARGSSTTMPILAKSKFEELLIPVAPFEVQEEFARVASNVSRVRSNLIAAWEAERQLFASLQSRAFRGEL